MATYKVIQDVEAEDKLVGPLTLRQFIYAGIMMFCLYFCFLGITKHLAFIMVVFLPIALVSGFFAFPWGREQPTEVWALAKIRFFFKPRRRIWDQSGLKELVTITVPKKSEVVYTDGLSQTEVKSRLLALADTIDSRGWAIKNVNVNMSNHPAYRTSADDTSDRLVDINSLPQAVSDIDVQASDDIMDEQNNPVAQQFEQMIEASERAHHQHVVQSMAPPQNTAAAADPKSTYTAQQPVNPPADYWFMNQANPANGQAIRAQVVAPGTPEADVVAAAAAEPTAAEKALASELQKQHYEPVPSYAHLRTIQPLSAQHQVPTPQAATTTTDRATNDASQNNDQQISQTPIQQTQNPPVTHQPDPAIIALASNNDLNVATIAREAKKQEAPDEIVISLH